MVKVLIVDDEQQFTDLLAQRLSTRDLDVSTAYDGHQALKLVHNEAFDIILLDISMPGPDGLSILKKIKKSSPLTEVILLTADSTVSTAIKGMKLGACDYLIKPAELEQVLQAITEAEQKRHNHLSQKRMTETAKLAALGELGTGVAHEINNPVHIMVNEAGWIEELLDEASLDPEVDKQIRHALQLIRDQAQRCKSITSKLLTLRPAHSQEADLASLVQIWQKVLQDQQQRIQKTKTIVHQSWAKEFNEQLWSQNNWTQILANLLDNALDALGNKPGQIKIKGSIQGSTAVLTLSDTGSGMEEHLLTRIFEPFFSTKDVGQGSGLGLAICHGFVESMGGEIMAQSVPGQGSVLTIKVNKP